MNLVKPHPQIYLFLGDTPADLGRPFLRLQEFYESPSKIFRRRFFTLEKFKAWYKRTQTLNGRFSYFTDYNGYNVPGDVFQEWATTYAGNETEDEQRLLGMMGPLPATFYVIGAPKDSAATLDHELSHAFWHLFPEYRRALLSMLLTEERSLAPVRRYLKASMYADDVLADEAAAYLMFDDPLLHAAGVSTKHLRGLRGGMRGVYLTYKAQHIRL